MNSNISTLVAKKISKHFSKNNQRVDVLRDVDFELKQGEKVGIVGPSGAGKSTFLHVLGTLERPSSGSVFYGQEKVDLFKMSQNKLSVFRNRRLGFIFQFHYLLPELTALENVALPAQIAGADLTEAQAKAGELLDYIGLSHRKGHKPYELSGGEQQRVSIARSVVLRPEIIFADELTGNLDSDNSQKVMDLLVKLNQETGVSIVLVTHDRSAASKMDRVITMKDGQIQTFG